MPANKFNEADKYLLEKWQQACLVEKSVKAIRLRFTEICARFLESIQNEHKTLDRCNNWVKSDWSVTIGRERWQREGNFAYIGIEYLCVENLWDDSGEHPFVGIWTGKPKKPAIDLKAIRRILSEAKTILTKDEFARCEWESSPDDEIKPSDCTYQYQLWYSFPEERKELRNMLLEGDGQPFVDCLVAHFEVFAKFIPILDEVFAKRGKK